MKHPYFFLNVGCFFKVFSFFLFYHISLAVKLFSLWESMAKNILYKPVVLCSIFHNIIYDPTNSASFMNLQHVKKLLTQRSYLSSQIEIKIQFKWENLQEPLGQSSGFKSRLCHKLANYLKIKEYLFIEIQLSLVYILLSFFSLLSIETKKRWVFFVFIFLDFK